MTQVTQQIPAGWEVQPLAEMCDILIGGTPSRNKPEYWDQNKEGRNVWISIRDLSHGGKYISDSSEYISDQGAKASNVKLIPKGNVLMSFKLTIGRVAITDREVYTNEAIAAFFIKNRALLDPNFLYYVLPILQYDTDTAIKGATLNKEKLKTTIIILPPLDEQTKIATILSKVDEEIEKVGLVIEQTEKLKKGLMQKLFTKGIGHTKFKESGLGEIPEKWEVCLLDSVAKRGSGHTPSKKDSTYYNGGIKWISLADSNKLDAREIHSTKSEISKAGIDNSSAVLHTKGTVLLSRDASVGRSAIMGEGMAVSQHFITWTCNSILHNWFLYYYLQFQKKKFEQIAMGSTIKTIGLSFFKAFKIPLPNIDEQRAISKILWLVDDKISINKKIKSQLLKLKKGLMNDLLSGRVRTLAD